MSNDIKYAELDAMPTEHLRSLLSLDIDETSGVSLDTDAILHILGVIQAREDAAGAEKPDVAAAWNDFNENYLPLSDDPDTDAEFLPPDAPACVAAAGKKHTRLRRTVVTLAAVIVLFAACTGVAGAAHIDLWGAIVQWASETFGLENGIVYKDSVAPRSDIVACKDLQQLLTYDHITDKLVPTWLPDGFTQVSCDRTGTPDMQKYRAEYRNGNREIILQIFAYSDGQQAVHTYEKLPDNYTIYSAGGIDHYISTNNDGSIVALWSTEQCECSILANCTETEIKEIIESMYGG